MNPGLAPSGLPATTVHGPAGSGVGSVHAPVRNAATSPAIVSIRFSNQLDAGTSSSALALRARPTCSTDSTSTSGPNTVLSMVSQISGASYSAGLGENGVISGSTHSGS